MKFVNHTLHKNGHRQRPAVVIFSGNIKQPAWVDYLVKITSLKSIIYTLYYNTSFSHVTTTNVHCGMEQAKLTWINLRLRCEIIIEVILGKTHWSRSQQAQAHTSQLMKNMKCSTQQCLVNCAEVVSLETSLKNGKKALICCIYRAPKTDLEQLNEFISIFCQNTRNKSVYLCGDFNIDLLQYDTNNVTNNFIDHLYSFGLHPLITRPTRITSHSKTLIDNIFTTNLSDIHSRLIINDLSDHLPIFLIFEYNHNKSKNIIYNTKRVVNDRNLNAMANKLKETN